ncbi:hypothetical protein IJJ27_00250 [bacterium]|nr:hypothetical protein [bacterium]
MKYRLHAWLYLLATIIWSGLVLLVLCPVITRHLDVDYLENLYATSQWMIPLSPRIMADDQLYQLAGYRILYQNADFFSINPETPPLGKILYGYFIGTNGQPGQINLLLALLALSALFACTYRFTHSPSVNKKLALSSLAVLMLALSPIFFTQLPLTMLDLLQMTFLLFHFLAISFYSADKPLWQRLLVLAFTGIFLGLFAGTKVPFFLPFIGLADLLYLYWSYQDHHCPLKRQTLIFELIALALPLGLTWLATYSLYFSRGGHLLDFLRAQKWVLDFYLHASHGGSWLSPIMVWITSFTGWYTSANTWVNNTNWNIILPLTFILIYLQLCPQTYHTLWQNFQQLTASQKYLLASLTLFLLANMCTSFYSRYLLLMYPLAIIMLVWLLAHYPLKYTFLTLTVLGLQGLMLLFPLPKDSIQATLDLWNHQRYHDLYFYLTPNSRPHENFRTFHQRLIALDARLQVSTLQVQATIPHFVSPWTQTLTTPATLTRTLDNGSDWTLPIALTWQRQGNTWQLYWQDSYLAPNFQPGDTLASEFINDATSEVALDDNLTAVIHPTQELYLDKTQLDASSEAQIITTLAENNLLERLIFENLVHVHSEGLDEVRLLRLQEPELITLTTDIIATLPALSLRPSTAVFYPEFIPNNANVSKQQHEQLIPYLHPTARIWHTHGAHNLILTQLP